MVSLPMALAVWNANEEVRSALLAAVAAAAGVGVGSVLIQSATAGRRALHATKLRITVLGAEGLRGLGARLRAGSHKALRAAEARWERSHQIRVHRLLSV
jgi:hypothetical protein